MTESNINTTFSRMVYNSIVKDLRAGVPGFKSSAYWGWKDTGGRNYEVQGPDGFYWYGGASNMWEAKFLAFCQIADQLGIDVEDPDEVDPEPGPQEYLVEYGWTKENHESWLIKGLVYVDAFGDDPDEPDSTIHPGMHEGCQDLLSLISGIHGALYGIFQVDVKLQDGDTFTVPAADIIGWNGQVKFHMPELTFETLDKIHIVPSKATLALIDGLKAEKLDAEKAETDEDPATVVFDLAGKAHSPAESLEAIAAHREAIKKAEARTLKQAAPYYDLAEILKDQKAGICRHRINKENWSGDETVVAGNWNTMHFTMGHMDSYIFRLEKIEQDEDKFGRAWAVKSNHWPSDYVLCSVAAPLPFLSATGDSDYLAYEGDLTRSGQCPFTAAAKLLCNTI